MRLPAELERRLTELFPRVRERERFIADTLRAALEGKPAPEEDQPTAIGGTLHLFTDGGSRGNPGQAAIACILEDPIEGKVLAEHAETIGVETNNVAEYKALIAGLGLAKKFQPNRLICHLDSELIVRQLNGEYRVKMPALKVFVDEVQSLAAELPDVVFLHIPREDNYRADSLVNRALDEEAKARKGTMPPRRPTPRPEPPQRKWEWE
ncbi:MAG: hypothetical protein G01um101425_131 [Candidatus Peregrinibacteria bacterium Gr01-1014_25]|nr:MAG: hypothetical protein G01um101425_131 [Candidatus Peregrinibacteria bacterium Gr01-1014_25]